MSFWPSDTAGDIADVCSALGLVVTAILTTGAWQVRNRFLKLILYPSHVQKLESHCSRLAEFLGTERPPADVSKEVGEARGDLNSLRPYVSGSQKKTLAKATDALEVYRANQVDENLTKLLELMYQLLREMQNLSEGLKY